MLQQVKASAGSGKTYALTAAFVEKLAGATRRRGWGDAAGQDYSWTDILAITFTNAAAAEMRARVIRTLKERALGVDGGQGPAGDLAAAAAVTWLQLLLRSLGGLNIKTIDSLLHQAVRLGGLELGLPPEFEPVFDMEAVADDLYDRLVQRAAAGDVASLVLVNTICDVQVPARDNKGLLPGDGVRGPVREVFRLRLARPELRLASVQVLQERRETLFETFLDAVHRMRERIAAEGLQATKNFLKKLEECAAAGTEAIPKESAYLVKDSLDDCLNKGSKGAASTDAYAVYTELTAGYAALAREGALLDQAVRHGPLAEAADMMLQWLDDEQRRTGRVASQRMEIYARELLDGDGVSEALFRMGSRMAHLLIDEFQDTSQGQWSALAPLGAEALSRGGTLFYVGDVKQAIYGWRGGDAALFNKVHTWPGVVEVVDEFRLDTLTHNWRSARDVVEFNNGFFGRLAEQGTASRVAAALLDKNKQHMAPDLAEMLQEAYADTVQQVPDKNADKRGLVRLTLMRGQNKDELHPRVQEWLRELLADELVVRRRPGEIAVLVRSNKEAGLVSQWCAEWDVPVVSANSLLLASHPLVRQFIALLRFLDYPLNDLAFWEFLSLGDLFPPEWRAEFEVDRQSLHDWLAAREPKGDKAPPLYRDFRDRFPGFWKRAVEPFFNRAGFMSPYDLTREVLARYHTVERRPEEIIFLRRLLEVVHAAEAQSLGSLSTFLEFWDEQGGEERVPLSENMNAVTVMTIHKSKGLEFPVVIAPFHLGGGGRNQELAWWLTEAGAALAPLAPAMGESYTERALPLLMEQINVLYVSWTRAAEELHCCISLTEKNTSPLVKVLGELVQEYGLVQDGDVYETGVAPQGAPPTPMHGPQLLPVMDGPPLDVEEYEPMNWLPGLRLYRSALEPAEFDARRRGELAHRCCEKLRWTGDPERDVEAALAEAFRGFSEPHDPAGFALAPEEVEQDCRRMLEWYIAQPDVAGWLQQARPELAIIDREGKTHRADMVTETDTHRLVVEYKTGRPDADTEATYVHQVQRYMRLLAPLGAKPLQGVIVYLDEERMQVVEYAGGEGERHA